MTFHIRPATIEDVQSITAVFDSTLLYLSSIGSGEMWGSEPFSQREGFVEDIEATINDEEVLVLVAERDEAGIIGVARAKNELPDHLEDKAGWDALPLLYLEVLVKDFRVEEELRKGVGEFLVEEIKRLGQEMGKKSLWVDAWVGNGDKLMRYYERLGFECVGSFELERRKSGGVWQGMLLKLDL